MNPNPQVWRTVSDAHPVSTVPRRRATPFRVRRALLTRWRVRMSWPTAGSATQGRPAPKWLSDGPTWTVCQGETSLLLSRQIHAIFFYSVFENDGNGSFWKMSLIFDRFVCPPGSSKPNAPNNACPPGTLSNRTDLTDRSQCQQCPARYACLRGADCLSHISKNSVFSCHFSVTVSWGMARQVNWEHAVYESLLYNYLDDCTVTSYTKSLFGTNHVSL